MAKKEVKKWRTLPERIKLAARELKTTEDFIVKLEAKRIKRKEHLAKLEVKAEAQKQAVPA